MPYGNRRKEAVLVPQAEARGGALPACYSCVRSLGKHGIHTIVSSGDGGVPEGLSRYCGETVTVPRPQEDLVAYKDALLGIAARPDVRTVVPVLEEDVYVLSKHREQFEQYVSLVVPSFETLRRVHDRVRLVEAAAEAGVPAPETWLLDEVPNWDRELLIKSRYNLLTSEYVGSFSPREAHTAKTVTHLRSGEEPDVEAIREEMRHTPIVQEFVPIEAEYMFTALYDHGEPLGTFQHRQIRGTSYVGGGGVYRESSDVAELEEVARELLDELEWHGLACIEYIEDARTGEFKPLEINPRMWQSSLATARMGADFPLYYWLQATGREERIEPGYDVGIGCHYLKGELSYLVSLLRDESSVVERPSLYPTLKEILVSFHEHPRTDYLRLDDPLPFCYDVLRTVRGRPVYPETATATSTEERLVPEER
jgi:predicted ATP-grasp superfamily ATP-dependent carboligase